MKCPKCKKPIAPGFETCPYCSSGVFARDPQPEYYEAIQVQPPAGAPAEQPAQDDLRFGKIAVSRKLVNAKQVEDCLESQRHLSPDLLLGEIFVQKGYLTAGQVDEIVRHQLSKRRSPPADERAHHRSVLLAKRLVAEGVLPQEEVNQALRIQSRCERHARWMPLREVLVRRGMVSDERARAVADPTEEEDYPPVADIAFRGEFGEHLVRLEARYFQDLGCVERVYDGPTGAVYRVQKRGEARPFIAVMPKYIDTEFLYSRGV